MGEWMSDVTFVITSCGRRDLLDQTLQSLFDTDWSLFDCKILVEDSGDPKMKEYLDQKYADVFDLIIFNDVNIGKLKSIDAAYSYVKTKYVFHCEDDWFFYRQGFLKDSIKILEHDENISMVSLRSYYWDFQYNSQLILDERIDLENIAYYKLKDRNEKTPMNGFCLNPGLRKLQYQKNLGRLQDIGAEYLLSKAYLNDGKYMVLLENSAINHIGWGEGLEDPGKEPLYYRKVKNLIKAFLNLFGAKYHLIN